MATENVEAESLLNSYVWLSTVKSVTNWFYLHLPWLLVFMLTFITDFITEINSKCQTHNQTNFN
jgi:hypothetical protein